ncbi:hypothetical protein RUM44_006161 [Polyplax serrata]|uniref:Uncharacterized protein n=1 Tax=Polyplax serrata TaxID=468196 RepID=A0ABR1AZK8_POLSC
MISGKLSEGGETRDKADFHKESLEKRNFRCFEAFVRGLPKNHAVTSSSVVVFLVFSRERNIHGRDGLLSMGNSRAKRVSSGRRRVRSVVVDKAMDGTHQTYNLQLG